VTDAEFGEIGRETRSIIETEVLVKLDAVSGARNRVDIFFAIAYCNSFAVLTIT
jgi:hypothetical protein